MRKLALISALGLLIGTVFSPSAFAIDSPNAPVSVNAANASPANTAVAAAAVTVSWTKPVVDATHPLPIAYAITATAANQTTVRLTVTPPNQTTTSFSGVLESLTGGSSYSIVVE
jgi:hypothetical protein